MDEQDWIILTELDNIVARRFISMPVQVYVLLYPSKRGSVYTEWFHSGSIHTSLLFTFKTIDEFRSMAKEYIARKNYGR